MTGSNSASKREMDKVFNDSVHGHISIPSICMEFVDTPAFQRLRNIKQLGGVNFVYPAACHSRFEHSLGTCYLAGKMAEALNANSKYKITDDEIECLQIAGLCHDLGHGPFSHLWETIVGEVKEKVKFKHEDLSIKIFERIVTTKKIWDDKENKNDRIQMVKDMITGIETPDLLKKARQDDEMKKWYLYQIVANKQNGIDVDKWDYFLRDGRQLNLKVTFDYRRLLENCKIMEVKVEDVDVKQVCFRDKEAFNIYEMFTNRATLHHKAYQHPVVKCVEAMLVDAIKKYDNSRGKKDDKWTEISKKAYLDSDIEQYLQLNDNILYELQRDQGSAEGIKEAKFIVDRVYKRKLYQRIMKRLEPYEKDPNAIKSKLIKRLKGKKGESDLLKEDHFEVSLINIKLSSEKGVPFNDIIFYTKNGEQKKKKLNDVMIFASVKPSTSHTAVQVLYKKEAIDPEMKKEVEEFLCSLARKEDTKS